MRRTLLVSGLATAVLLSGCAAQSEFLYLPTEELTAITRGFPTARYQVPPEAPRGDVRIAAFGVTELNVAPDRRAPFLQVHLTVSNDSGDQPWIVDKGEQDLILPHVGTIKPRFVDTVPREPRREITVPAGQSQTLNLFYPLPQQTERVPQFDLLWRIQISPERLVAERTPFVGEEVRPSRVAYPYYGYPGYHAGPRFSLGFGFGLPL